MFNERGAVEGPLYLQSEAFSRQMVAIASENSLLLHIEDVEATPGILIDWLSRLQSRCAKFYVAFSGSRHGSDILSGPVRRVELSPLDRYEVRAVIDARFSPNRIPDDLYHLLHVYS